MDSLNKKFFVLLIILVILLIGVSAWFGILLGKKDVDSPSSYSAVYLTSGDVYFGKLSWFPKPRLTDVWLLQRTVNVEGQEQITIVPFTGAFWEPVNTLNLNPKEIIFWTHLRKSSQVAQALKNQELFGDAQVPRTTQTPQVPGNPVTPLQDTNVSEIINPE